MLHVEGAFRAPLTRELPHEVQTLLCHGTRTIVLDFTGVSSIDAAGIGQLVRLYNLDGSRERHAADRACPCTACANSSTGLRFSSSWTCRPYGDSTRTAASLLELEQTTSRLTLPRVITDLPSRDHSKVRLGAGVEPG